VDLLMSRHDFKALPTEDQVDHLHFVLSGLEERVDKPRPINWRMAGPMVALLAIATTVVSTSLTRTSDAVEALGGALSETKDEIMLIHRQDIHRLEASDRSLELVDAGASQWRTGTERELDRISAQAADILREIREMRKAMGQ
jgi:hypothetical protein